MDSHAAAEVHREFVPLRGWYEALKDLLDQARDLKDQARQDEQKETLLQLDAAALEMTAQHPRHVAWTLSDDGAWIVVYRLGRIHDSRYPQFYIPVFLIPGLITGNGFSGEERNTLWEKFNRAVALRRADGRLRLHRRSRSRKRFHRPRFRSRI